jgi:hypothetical protein
MIAYFGVVWLIGWTGCMVLERERGPFFSLKTWPLDVLAAGLLFVFWPAYLTWRVFDWRRAP